MFCGYLDERFFRKKYLFREEMNLRFFVYKQIHLWFKIDILSFDPLKVSNLYDYTTIVGENIGFLIDGIILTENKTNDCYVGT